jgi:DNA-binding CsgD family transcriptional regulator
MSMAHVTRLTKREIQVLLLVAKGWSTKEIARALEITPRTVEGHVEHARLKSGSHNRAQLVAQALVGGWFPSEAALPSDDLRDVAT